MVIFHSYVSLPEGNFLSSQPINQGNAIPTANGPHDVESSKGEGIDQSTIVPEKQL